MRQYIRDIWIEHNRDLEGIVDCYYADVLGLVTIGMGNLVDAKGLTKPPESALTLPMRRRGSGVLVSRAEKSAAWHAVRNDPKCATKGWKYAAKLPANQLYLDPADVETLIFAKLTQHDVALAQRFPDWDDRPDRIQLAVHSMAWAGGSAVFGKFPKWSKAFLAHDYKTCAAECKLEPDEGTLKTRNALNKAIFLEADGTCPSAA